MPIYEYYCPDNHTVYQFYAKTLAQGRTVPKCPENPKFRMRKIVSAFAISRPGAKEAEGQGSGAAPGVESPEDARMDAALDSMEKEFDQMDENDPKAMARMMRRMSELSGEKLEGEAEEVIRKLEEGADPDDLEEQLGGGDGSDPAKDPLAKLDPTAKPAGEKKEPRHRFKALKRVAPRRDPTLYDF